jgi:hypothetical protein
MKNIIFSIVLMLIASISVAQQAQKNLLKTFDLNGHNEVVLHLDGDVNIERWNNSMLRIQMDISYQNASVNIMKYLISKGRYDLTMTAAAEGLVVEHPNRIDATPINKEGTLLEETIVYTVYVPQNVVVMVNKNGQTTVLNSDKTLVAQ